MIAALDSAFPPTRDQALTARSAGVKGWWGYIATRSWGASDFNLLHIWTADDMTIVKEVFGDKPIMYGSGWDDPAALGRLAGSLGVRLGLDLEAGIRGDGAWVDPWLTASGAGLYGGCGVHYHGAPWHVLAWYPGFDPGGTWYSPCGAPPAEPHGLQWEGTHNEFGVSVDRGWYDDFFGGIQEDSSMGRISFRPGGPNDRYDRVRVRDGNLHRWFGDSIGSPGMKEGLNLDGSGIGHVDEGNPGVRLLAGTEFCSWQSRGDWIIYGAMGVDGNDYEFFGNLAAGNVSGWFKIADSSGDLPLPGPPAPPTFMPHKHVTDGGVPL